MRKNSRSRYDTPDIDLSKETPGETRRRRELAYRAEYALKHPEKTAAQQKANPKERHAAHGLQLDFFIHLKKDGTPRKPKGVKPTYTVEEAAERRKASQRETKRKWRLAHPEENKKRVKDAYEKRKSNPDNKKREALQTRKWRRENPEKEKQQRRKNQNAARKADPERFRAKARADHRKHAPKRNAESASRKRVRRISTPPWVDKATIAEIYMEAAKLSKSTGVKHHVDHIIPLVHKRVCGIHVSWNLRIIPAVDNMSKHNKFYQHMAFAPGLLPLKFYCDEDLIAICGGNEEAERLIRILDQPSSLET